MNSIRNKVIKALPNCVTLFIHVGEKTLVSTLIVCGVLYNEVGFELNRLKLLVAAGLVAGLYNGLCNDHIWRAKGGKTRLLAYPIPYLAHTVFNHIVGGLIGAVSLYFLLDKINIYELHKTIKGLGWVDFVLFLVAITGYIGLLPRTLWYGSYGATLGIKK